MTHGKDMLHAPSQLGQKGLIAKSSTNFIEVPRNPSVFLADYAVAPDSNR